MPDRSSWQRQALVIWASPDCGACQESARFFRDLTALPRATDVVLLGRESVDVLTRFAAEHKLTPDRIVSTAGSNLRFRFFPTMVLMSRSGSVSQAWVGRDPKREASLIDLVRVGGK